MPNLAGRSVHVHGVVDDSLANDVASRLLWLNAEDDAEPIVMFINTEGGSVTAGFAIYDAIKYIESPVWTIGIEAVAGIGLLLLAAGSKGNRFLLPDSTVTLTDITFNPDGAGALGEVAAKEAGRIRSLLIGAFVADGGSTTDEISSGMKAGRSFRADAAVQHGFADKILSFYSLLKLITM